MSALRSRACRCSAIWRAIRSSVDDQEVVTGARHGGQTEHQDRTGRRGLVDLVAVLVEHGPDAAVGLAGRRSSRRRAACRAGPARSPPGRGPCPGAPRWRRPGRPDRGLARRSSSASAVSRIASSRLVDAGARAWPTRRRTWSSPPYSSATRPYSVSWARTLLRVGALLVDLVDRDHDRHVGRLGVVERLDGLRHHAVVGRDHQDHDVGDLGTTGTHGGERLVTRGVDEGDLALLAVVLGRDLVGADVLGDAAGLARPPRWCCGSRRAAWSYRGRRDP